MTKNSPPQSVTMLGGVNVSPIAKPPKKPSKTETPEPEKQKPAASVPPEEPQPPAAEAPAESSK